MKSNELIKIGAKELKINQIKTFIFDVDGVLTDGKILLHPSGEQMRSMNVKDGMAIREAIKKGYLVVFGTKILLLN